MKRDCTIHVAKTKALISLGVTAKLICVFVLAYAKNQVFSRHGSYHFESTQTYLNFSAVTVWSCFTAAKRSLSSLICLSLSTRSFSFSPSPTVSSFFLQYRNANEACRENQSSGFLTRYNTNRAEQQHKMVRG